MYRIELIDKNEILQAEHNYKDKQSCMIAYNKVKNSVNVRYKLHGLTMQVFEGQDVENLKELKKYRIEF